MARNEERRVWASVNVAVDTHKPHHLYVVQELLGAWVTNPHTGESQFVDAEGPLLTRVLYARMTESGKLENVNTSSWEGRK